jgi:cellulose synthase/poly-beta-1,6-N-acetylglucosamine synthase-like glycosyltransferase
VIIDDGGTDATEAIVSACDDKRIIYVRQKHVGVHRLAETYNRGLKLARGKFIAILEGDDMIPKRKLELQVPSFKDDNVVLSFGKCVLVNEAKKFLGMYPRSGKRFNGWTDWLSPLLNHYYITGGTVMLRKDALMKIGGFNQPPNTVAVDYSTYLELALIGKFCYVNEFLGIWRRHGRSWSDSALGSNVAMQYVIPFCQKHGLPIPWEELMRQRGRDLFHVARHQLLNGDNRKALDTFKRSFTLCSGLGKVKSLGGMAASVLNMDLENIAEKIGRPIEK